MKGVSPIEVILRDVSTSKLIHAIEANMFAFRSNFGRLSGSELHDDPEKLWFVSDIPHFIFNTVYRARFAPEEVEVKIEETLAPYVERSNPMIWWTGPATQPADLGEKLLARGFTHHGVTTGMAMDLSALEEGRPGDISNNFQIMKVTTVELLAQYMQVFESFGLPDFLLRIFSDLYADMALQQQIPWTRYVGLADGKPVAIADLYLGEGVAGIYSVATVHGARQQGFGTAITRRPLLDAKELGYRVGILQATEMARGMYERLGFREYCQLEHFLWEG